MLKDALEYIAGLVPAKSFTVDVNDSETTFFDKKVHRVPDPRQTPLASALKVGTLESFADFIVHNIDHFDLSRHLVHVESPNRVVLASSLEDFHRRREVALAAEYSSGVEQVINQWVPLESFRINLMALFSESPARSEVLEVLRAIKLDNSEVREDNGLSQKVTVSAGTQTLRVAAVPCPVVLAPFRTFPEVEQPASPFILRLDDKPSVLLKPADGNAWTLVAVQRVGQKLRELLAEKGCAEYPKVIF